MPGLHARADDQHLVAEVAARHRLPLGRQLRDGRGDDRARRGRPGRPRAARAGCAAPRRARRPSSRARWRSASARPAASPSNVPKWVWVLPTSTARSIARAIMVAPWPRKLYVVHGSHPCAAVEARARAQGRPLQARRAAAGDPRRAQRAASARATVPGHQARGRREGRRLARDHAPARRAGPRARAAIRPMPSAARRSSEAEEWGDEVLQPLVRRLSWAVLKRMPRAVASFSANASLPVPTWMARPSPSAGDDGRGAPEQGVR